MLSDRLSSISETSFQVYGHSLAGFELPNSSTARNKCEKGTRGEKEVYYNLEEQISYVQSKLDEFISTHHGPNENDTGKSVGVGVPKVILIGHSVGSYIAMEVLRRHRERQRQQRQSTVTKDISSTGEGGEGAEFDIIGGVMLFPTVVDIAKSPAGRRLSVRFPSHPFVHHRQRQIANTVHCRDC